MKKSYPFALLLAICFWAGSVAGQQWHRSTPNWYSRDINSVAILNRHSVFSAGGSKLPTAQSIFRTDDYGLAWDFIFDNSNSWIKSLAFTDSLHGFAVGYNGALIKSVNGYTNWTYITSPVATDFNKVFYADTQTLFAVGGKLSDSSQVILKSVNGGANWSVLLNQPGRWLKAVYFTGLQNGVAVGDSGTILKTINGGTSWSPVAAPVLRDLNGIVFLNALTGYIVGGKETNDSVRTILKTTDGGDNWNVVMDEPGGWLTDITFLDQNTGYIVGDRASLFRTTNAGQNWLPQTINQSTGNEHLTSVKFLDPTFGVIGANDGNVFMYLDVQQPEIDTLSGMYHDSTTFVTKSLIHAHNTPCEVHVEFSTSPGFAPLYYSYNQYLSGDTMADVGIYLQGLFTNTTYYYRLVVKSILGTQYYDTLSFYTYTPHYLIETDPATNVTLTSAYLNGRLANFFTNANPYFIFSTHANLSQGITQQTNPSSITDTLLHFVSAGLNFLSPNTTYYYTLSAPTPYGYITGDTLSFFTGPPAYVFGTLSALNVTGTSATMQGQVENLTGPTTMLFEYGTTTNFGDTILAMPSNVTDTGYHLIATTINSLLPNTTYYYRLKGNASNYTYLGNTQTFFTATTPIVLETHAATGITQNSAVLNGSVDDFPVPVHVYFEYGITPGFGQTQNANPSNINDSLQHDVYASVGPLITGTTYYFRLKGETSIGNYYGNTFTFATNNPFTILETTPATDVHGNSAQLNGLVSGLQSSTTLGFEYGATSQLGSYVAATPALVNDAQTHIVSTIISGFSPGHIYYYRLKANLNGIDFYGAIKQVYIGPSGIPNWDFQYWRPDTFHLLNAWNIPADGYERVPGHSGNYALRLTGSTFALLGVMNDDKKNGNNGPGFFGGVAFNARPDSVSVFMNYAMVPGDTAIFLVYMYRDSTKIAMNPFPVAGNSGGAFQKLTFAMSYDSPATPDSLIVAIVPFNINGNGVPNDADWVIVDDISFSPAAPVVYNGDFETWFDYYHNTLLDWTYARHMLVDQTNANDPSPVSNTFFNPPGDTAVELHNTYAYGNWFSAEISNMNSMFGDKGGGFPVHARHQTLNGYYKWLPANGDTMEISLDLFSNGQSIGGFKFQQADSVPQFTRFDIPINYTNMLLYPDTAQLFISSSVKPAKGPSRLVIDKLSFDGFTGIDDNVWVKSTGESGLKIYPNPTRDLVKIELEDNIREGDVLQLFSVNGQLLSEQRLLPGQNKIELDLSDVSAGFYLLNVKTGNRCRNGRIVVVK